MNKNSIKYKLIIWNIISLILLFALILIIIHISVTSMIRFNIDEKLYEIANQFDCHAFKFALRKFSKDDPLSNFLIDNGVQSYGMQIAGLYQKYISFQNDFLDNVICNIPKNNENNVGGEKLEYLSKFLVNQY